MRRSIKICNKKVSGKKCRVVRLSEIDTYEHFRTDIYIEAIRSENIMSIFLIQTRGEHEQVKEKRVSGGGGGDRMMMMI